MKISYCDWCGKPDAQSIWQWPVGDPASEKRIMRKFVLEGDIDLCAKCLEHVLREGIKWRGEKRGEASE